MFDIYRKYGHVCVLLVLSVFVACFFVDDCSDFQRAAIQVYTSSFTNLLEDDFDFDEDDEEDFVLICASAKPSFMLWRHDHSNKNMAERKRAKALLGGQVRRHFPRSNTADSHNYAFFANEYEWRGLFHATLFALKTNLLHYECNKHYFCHPDPYGGHWRFLDGLPSDELAS